MLDFPSFVLKTARIWQPSVEEGRRTLTMNYILISVLVGRYINYLVRCFNLLIPFSYWFDFRLFKRAQSL